MHASIKVDPDRDEEQINVSFSSSSPQQNGDGSQGEENHSSGDLCVSVLLQNMPHLSRPSPLQAW